MHITLTVWQPQTLWHSGRGGAARAAGARRRDGRVAKQSPLPGTRAGAAAWKHLSAGWPVGGVLLVHNLS